MNAKENTPNKENTTTPGTPQVSKSTPEKNEGSGKWKNYSEDKQRKLYENTVSFVFLLRPSKENQLS